MKTFIKQCLFLVGLLVSASAYGQSVHESQLFLRDSGLISIQPSAVSVDGQTDLRSLFADLILNGNFADDDYYFTCRFQGGGRLGQGSRFTEINLPIPTSDPRFEGIILQGELNKGPGVRFNSCSGSVQKVEPDVVQALKVLIFEQQLKDNRIGVTRNLRLMLIPKVQDQGALSPSVDFSQPLALKFQEPKLSTGLSFVTDNGTGLRCLPGGDCEVRAEAVSRYQLATGPVRKSPTRSGGVIRVRGRSGSIQVLDLGKTNNDIAYDPEFIRACSASASPLEGEGGFSCNAIVRLVDNQPVVGQVKLTLSRKDMALTTSRGNSAVPFLFDTSAVEAFAINDQDLTNSLNTLLPNLSTGPIVDGEFFSIQKTDRQTYLFQLHQ